MRLQNLVCPMITSWHFAKKSGSFDCAIWKFKLPLLSQGKSVHENRTISIQSLKDSSFPYITSWTFRKNSFVEVFWNLKLSLLSRTEIFWTIEQFWSGALKIWTDSIITSWNFLKIKRFCWSDLKIWPAPIITSRNVVKNKTVLLKCSKNLTCPYYHELKFSENKAVLLKWFENLNWPFYHELKFSQK